MSLRILQLTDPHLFADPAARLKGVPTDATFRDVLEFIRSQRLEFDYAVLTGDLTHEGELGAYQTLRRLLGDWLPRCRLIPGNHDRRNIMRSVFGDVVPTEKGAITFSLEAGDWLLVGLDTLVPEQGAGRIDARQFQWLEDTLAKHSDRPTAVFMHHQPVPVGSAWLDRIGLEDSDALLKLASARPQLQVVCCGHVHQEFEGTLGEATVLASPSTGLQFVPRTEMAVYAHEPPGFRVIELHDDDFESEVFRLPTLEHPPE